MVKPRMDTLGEYMSNRLEDAPKQLILVRVDDTMHESIRLPTRHHPRVSPRGLQYQLAPPSASLGPLDA